MTNRINKAEGADGVHRLIDMVVEEVSLVDRAANKHRFLIVKRDDAMDDNTPTRTREGHRGRRRRLDDAVRRTPRGRWPTARRSGPRSLRSRASRPSSSCSAPWAPTATTLRLAALAEQLRATAEQILERSGFAAPGDGTDAVAPADVQARAKTDAVAKPGGAPTFAADLAATKQALSRLAALASKAAPANTEKRDAPPAAAEPAPVAESLAKLADSFRALSDTVKEQQQRLGRVEKQFGLPNSAAPAEHVSKASVEDVGWPLDLNKPKDRESVDKAVSFHDL